MREIRSGSTVAPNPVSWLIFGLISLSNGVILFGKISLLILFFPFLMGIAQFTIAYLSWHKREGQIDLFDISALIIGILALMSWVSFRDIVPEYWWVSVMLIFIADLVGFLPTLRDAWYHPENDDVSTWMVFTLVGILVLIGLMLDKGNTRMDIAYPLYETVLALSTSCILFFRKKGYIESSSPELLLWVFLFRGIVLFGGITSSYSSLSSMVRIVSTMKILSP